ncbi:hypothetical protein TERTU_1464 [Teredinibacter turnerae T7901]|uniref:Uncharacterized protein n=1 Tax=Teredinibacter turnerae (strain ATCC 39867 / T7901) TaxID=377629 RepID=C5BSR0_TERTT|nr:hypothetical protein TERTU_1464 [Teredinibacter turnerae T7901]
MVSWGEPLPFIVSELHSSTSDLPYEFWEFMGGAGNLSNIDHWHS